METLPAMKLGHNILHHAQKQNVWGIYNLYLLQCEVYWQHLWNLDQYQWIQMDLIYTKFMNNYHDLEWIFSPLYYKVNFLDITIALQDQKIHTTLYKKPENVYLYIPPNSSHPPGIFLDYYMATWYTYTLYAQKQATTIWNDNKFTTDFKHADTNQTLYYLYSPELSPKPKIILPRTKLLQKRQC